MHIARHRLGADVGEACGVHDLVSACIEELMHKVPDNYLVLVVVIDIEVVEIVDKTLTTRDKQG